MRHQWARLSDSTRDNSSLTSNVYGAWHVFEATADAVTVARFTNSKTEVGSPAVIETKRGQGKSLYLGFLPGLSYFAPAIPARPTDRGGTDKAFSHFVPTEFDGNVLSLLMGSISDDYVRPIQCSNPLVHAKAVVATGSKGGVVIPLVNWSAVRRITGLNVTVATSAAPAGMLPSLASGNQVTATVDGGSPAYTVYTLDFLEVADALILRHESSPDV